MSEDPKQAIRQGIEAMLERVANEKMQGLSADDLKSAMSHPKAAETVAELLPLEASSVQVGEPAPDFDLAFLPGQQRGEGERLALSSHFGEQPVALIFGSYT